jgi:ribosome-binding ATPase YchF (GTP1/OBG family)
MSQNIQKDLQTIPQELKNIQKKQKTLEISQQVQSESKDLTNMISKTQLQPQDKETLDKTAKDTQAQVLALIIDTQDEINQCPTSFQNQLTDLQKYFTDNVQTLVQWPIDDITKVRTFLGDIDNDVKAGNCLEAMVKIDSINQILQIHSLDIKVETSTPEN